MRLIALLSWYDEEPGWLDAAIRSLEQVGVDHVVCCDGAYNSYPNARNRSGIAQYEAITRATHNIGAGLTIHTPQHPWQGNEIEKRSYLFQLADQVAQPEHDWYLILDADEQITNTPPDLHQRLTTTVLDVAQVTFNEPRPGRKPKRYPIPILFRAIPGIRVVANHYTYVTPNGRNLWGNAVTDRLEPRLDLTDLEVQHLTHYRQHDRRKQARAFYRQRDNTGLEGIRRAGSCSRCPKPSTHQVLTNWRPDEGGYAADWARACDTCAALITTENHRRIRAWGHDPAEFPTQHHRYDQLPSVA